MRTARGQQPNGNPQKAQLPVDNDCSIDGFSGCVTPHDFLKQSLGQRQQLMLNIAFRQGLLELLDAGVGDPRGSEV